jgi:hypothetical protein
MNSLKLLKETLINGVLLDENKERERVNLLEKQIDEIKKDYKERKEFNKKYNQKN